jgi:predicted lipid-binding transport protein (Tim44 family)
MKAFIVAIAIALVSATSLPGDAFAARLGGGRASGMQRSLPARSAPQEIPSKPVTPAAQPAAPSTAAPAPAAAPRRSWLGPIAGLAAGLGIAALMSHLGLGEEFGNIVMLLLLAALAIGLIRFLLRRFARAAPRQILQPAGASFGGEAPSARPFSAAPGMATSVDAGSVPRVPAGFDVPGFERVAKLIFIRMQAANDLGDLDDLRNFMTPEMFAAARLDLQDRGAVVQRTDVQRVDAEVLDVVVEPAQQVVSVRFHGLISEDGAASQSFDEIWHLVRPNDASREWAIAGLQPTPKAFEKAA